MVSFGEELKRERELRDISLKEIAEATKISIRFLEALEENNFEILPGGVFNRGFIRAYSRFIGVDGDEMVNAYLQEMSVHEKARGRGGREELRAAAQAISASPPGAAAAHSPIGLTEGIFRPPARPAPRAERKRDIPTDSRPVERDRLRFVSLEAMEGRSQLVIWVLVAVAFLVGATLVTFNFLADKGTSGSREPGETRESGAVPASSSVVIPVLRLRATPTADTEAFDEPGEAASPIIDTAPSATTSEGGPDPKPEKPHTLWIRATEATEISVACSGKVVLERELWRGHARTVSCAGELALSASNAGALEYSVDGAEVQLLGALGEAVQDFIVLTTAPPPPPVGSPPPPEDPNAGA